MKLLEADNINEAENVMRTEKINEKKFNIMRVIINYLYIDKNLNKKGEIWRIRPICWKIKFKKSCNSIWNDSWLIDRIIIIVGGCLVYSKNGRFRCKLFTQPPPDSYPSVGAPPDLIYKYI